MQNSGVNVPLWVSHREAVEQMGPLGTGLARALHEWEVAPGAAPAMTNRLKKEGG